jgi:methylmalonyl-CoA mutase, C-terminal domain
MTEVATRPRPALKGVRALVAKPGLDGHDRGAKVVARALRDAGCDVIYTGIRQTPESIVSASIEEDIDVICLSILSGAHMYICRELRAELEKAKLDTPVVLGGIIPPEDWPQLKELGVSAIFGPGSSLEQICSEIESIVTTARTA